MTDGSVLETDRQWIDSSAGVEMTSDVMASAGYQHLAEELVA